MLKRIVGLLLLVFVVGCVGKPLVNDTTTVEIPTAKQEPIKMVITNDMIKDFCYSKKMTGSIEPGTTGVYSSDVTCIKETEVITEYFKYDVRAWLEEKGVVSSDELLFNITDEVYNIFCEQNNTRIINNQWHLKSVNYNTISCYSKKHEGNDYSYDEVVRWYLRQRIDVEEKTNKE